jgi:magnesium-transporting ATPase (P-type)
MKQPDSFNREIFIVFYRYAIIFHGVRDGMLEVTFKGKMRRYQQLHVLEFDPTRKRMSVIVKYENGNDKQVIYIDV